MKWGGKKHCSEAVGSISLVKKGKDIDNWKAKSPGKNVYRGLARMSGDTYCMNRVHLKARQTGACGYLKYLEQRKHLTHEFMKSM